MIALITKYYAPTNTKGARIMVKGFGYKKVYDWNYALDTRDNYATAMDNFVKELNKKVAGGDYMVTDIAYVGEGGIAYIGIVK